DYAGRRVERFARRLTRYGREEPEEDPPEPGGSFLYRQLGYRRAGFRIHYRHQQWRPVETSEPHQAREGSAADHQALYGVRCSRRRGSGGPQLRVVCAGAARTLVSAAPDSSGTLAGRAGLDPEGMSACTAKPLTYDDINKLVGDNDDLYDLLALDK